MSKAFCSKSLQLYHALFWNNKRFPFPVTDYVVQFGKPPCDRLISLSALDNMS
jgi:hypothetical protein